jgi:hypothetical protein
VSERSTERDENGEELVDGEGRNQTQQALDDDLDADTPAAAPWGSGENESD